MVIEEHTGPLSELFHLFKLSIGTDDKSKLARIVAVEETRGTRFYVAKQDGKAIGFVGVFVDPEGVWKDLEPAQVIDLAVLPAWQGKGIGRLLLGVAESLAIECGHRCLWLFTALEGDATHFYRRVGYEQKAVVPGFFPEGYDRVWFCKRLSADLDGHDR